MSNAFIRLVCILVSLASVFPSLAAAAEGVSFSRGQDAWFVLPTDGVVYGEKCTEENLAPRSIGECFGSGRWPNENTPRISEGLVRRSIEEARKSSVAAGKDIAQLEELIQRKQAIVDETKRNLGRFAAKLQKVQAEIDFLNERLKDVSLPPEAVEELERSRSSAIGQRQFISGEEGKELSAIAVLEGAQKRFGDEITRVRETLAVEKQFNDYITREEANLFNGKVVRNLSASEPFGGALEKIFREGWNALILEWEGPEPAAYSEKGIVSRFSLKRIRQASALAPGVIQISLNRSGWETGLGTIDIPFSAETIKAGGVLEGGALPSQLRQPYGRFAIWNYGKVPSQYAIRVGEKVAYVSLSTANSMAQNWLLTMHEMGGLFRSNANNEYLVQAPVLASPFSIVLSAGILSNGLSKNLSVSERYNGRNGVPYCPKSLEFLVAIDDGIFPLKHRVLNSGQPNYTLFNAYLKLAESVAPFCSYTGAKRPVSVDRPLRVAIDGVNLLAK